MSSEDHAARLTSAGRRVRHWDAEHPWALNTAVVLVVFLLFCVPDLSHDRDHGDGPIVLTDRPLVPMLLLQIALVAPLWFRRRFPLATLYTVLAVFSAQWAASIFLRADVAVLVAVYSLVLHGKLRRLPWAVPGLLAAVGLVLVRLSKTLSVWDVLVFVAIVGTAAVALGFAIRIRRAQLVALRERAVQLEIERDQRSLLAAATERSRVAREMHDILGHSLSVIITLADGGGYAAPERSKEALKLIGDTGRASLAELRRMLGVLREQSDEPSLTPQPGIADLDALCRQIRAAGPEVEYRSAGALDDLDRGVQSAAYRIAQEALTNALKHAGPRTKVFLSLKIETNRLKIAVRNTGPVPKKTVEGHGLVGMRERAALYGGRVEAGPDQDGWAVTAELETQPA